MSKAKGSAFERVVKTDLERCGWLVTKSGGSLGAADLVALRRYETPLLVQCKATKRGPFDSFGPAERRELKQAARQSGADAVLAWKEPRKGIKYIYPDQWPSHT